MSEAPNIRAVRAEDGRALIVTWRGGAESIVGALGGEQDVAAHVIVVRIGRVEARRFAGFK